ncbi:MAG TPA: 6-pyruvoyl-tetrahydropterin synthase-related protein, partial [Blastocatellia bacterium]|nr:6-pyruvoyl-tetrahydropterin synthase-related protein [Blastocatellia bacterium]
MQESPATEIKTKTAAPKPRFKPRLMGLLTVVAAFAVSAVAVAPFYFSRPETVGGQRVYRIPETHDLENLIPAIEEFDRGLGSGLLYTRWFATINNGYGTATGNFYPPGIYYLASLINRFVGDWIMTLFVISLLGLAASGLSLYLFARQFYSGLPSAVGSLLYMLAPYHMLDLYWRGAIPEFLGFAFIPLVLYFAYRLGNEGRLRHLAALGVVYGVYLMTHFPVGYIFTYVLAAYALLSAIKERDVKVGLRIAGGMVLAFAVASIYLLPAALEGKYAYEWASELFPYHSMYMTLMQTTDLFAQRVNLAWIFHALVLVVAIVALRATAKVEESRASLQTR